MKRPWRLGRRPRWLALGLAGLLVIAGLVIGGLLLADRTGRTQDQIADLETRLKLVQEQLTSQQQVILDLSSTNTALKDNLTDSLMKLQDIYFDLLKRNDGLQPLWERAGRWAFLTFDDGPTENTLAVLDVLRAQRVRATFFVNGRPEMAAIYQRINAEGHVIGNHTYSHDYGRIYHSVTEFVQDVDRLDALLGSLRLRPAKLYRFPGGAKNDMAIRISGPDTTARISAALAERGFKFYEWNVAVGDGESKPSGLMYSGEEIATSVINQARMKRIAVILLHDGPGHKASALALPRIIGELRSLGFQFDVLQ